MTNIDTNTNIQSANAIQNNVQKLESIILEQFQYTTPEREAVWAEPANYETVINWFYEHCQSGRLLELDDSASAKVRSCYSAITNANLLPTFWEQFKLYRKNVQSKIRAEYKNKLQAKANSSITDNVKHSPDKPNVWSYLGITIVVDKAVRQIKITDRTLAGMLAPLSLTLDLSWNLPKSSPSSRKDLERIKKTLKAKGLIAEIDRAIAG